MYIIKMNPDKSLLTTKEATIYQNEKNADTLAFLIPKEYDGEKTSECSLHLGYFLPEGSVGTILLKQDAQSDFKNYDSYSFKLTSPFTDFPGKVRLWLVMKKGDSVVLKSGYSFLNILPSGKFEYQTGEDSSEDDVIYF